MTVYTDSDNDTILIRASHVNPKKLYMSAEQSGRKASVLLTEQQGRQMRDQLLELYPLDVPPVQQKPVVIDYTSIEQRVIARLTEGGQGITINATGNVIINSK